MKPQKSSLKVYSNFPKDIKTYWGVAFSLLVSIDLLCLTHRNGNNEKNMKFLNIKVILDGVIYICKTRLKRIFTS